MKPLAYLAILKEGRIMNPIKQNNFFNHFFFKKEFFYKNCKAQTWVALRNILRTSFSLNFCLQAKTFVQASFHVKLDSFLVSMITVAFPKDQKNKKIQETISIQTKILVTIPMALAKSIFVSLNTKLINCYQVGFNILNNRDCLLKNRVCM